MSKGITRHFADTFKYNIKITQAKRKRRRGEREKKPRLTKKSLWRRDENTWNSTNFPNNHTQMGIPPIRIDCTPPPLPNPCPITRAGSVSWCAWTVTARAFESNFQPAESYPTPSPGGGGWSPGKGRWTRKAREKREQRERRNKRQKDREGRKREERGTGWKSTEDPAQLFCTRRTSPSSFSTLPSARNSIFVSARVYTRFSLPRRQWKATLHRAPPVYIVYPPISADENELSSFERAEFVHRPSSDRLLLRARMATKTRLRATHRE